MFTKQNSVFIIMNILIFANTKSLFGFKTRKRIIFIILLGYHRKKIVITLQKIKLLLQLKMW